MPRLDPQVRQVLDRIAATGHDSGTISGRSVDDQRTAVADDPLLQNPAMAVASVEARTIPGAAGDIPVRIYTPQGGRPVAIVLHFHGGGWSTGSIDLYDPSARELCARSRSVVVSVAYRLAPEHPFPAALDDCFAATAWASEHAAELGVGPDRLAVVGWSAGGNLAAAVALAARDRGGPPISYQALVYPATAASQDSGSMHEFATGYWITRETAEWCWTNYAQTPEDRANPYAAPLLAGDLAGLPPALVITAECDPLRDEGEAYAARLAEAGVPVRLSRYFGVIHGFVLMRSVIDRGREAFEEVTSALARHLGADDAGAGADAQAREVVRRYFEDCLGRGDLDMIEELHSEDFVWHSPSGRDLDRQATSDFVRTMYEAHDDVSLTVHDLVSEGDRVVVRFTMDGRQVRTWNRQEPAGQRLAMRGHCICRVADGRIVEEWEEIGWRARASAGAERSGPGA